MKMHTRRTAASWARLAVIVVVAGYLAATAARVYARNYYLFLPGYVRWMTSTDVAPAGGPTHIFVLFADHFEPDYDAAKTREWSARYASMAARHRDADGRMPQHTWFYPGEQPDAEIFSTLQDLVHRGFGEVEMHLHHAYDTADSLRVLFGWSIPAFQQYGFLKTVDGRTAWSFIHGNFGLDNGNGQWLCGVNDEIRLLHEMGCYCDFDFPAVYELSQPPLVNTIYAAKDDPRPKSYDTPYPLSALRNGTADLMMFQGPLLLAPSTSLRHLFIDVEDGDIHPAVPATARRVDRWVRAGVHVSGRPDWIFIKLFAHGISSPEDEQEVVGPDFDNALSYLERTYNDQRRYVLHYVTAREAYNLAMAAADGKTGDPEQYYDATIPPYLSSAPRPAAELTVRARPQN